MVTEIQPTLEPTLEPTLKPTLEPSLEPSLKNIALGFRATDFGFHKIQVMMTRMKRNNMYGLMTISGIPTTKIQQKNAISKF